MGGLPFPEKSALSARCALAVPSALLMTIRLGALGALVLIHLEASFFL